MSRIALALLLAALPVAGLAQEAAPQEEAFRMVDAYIVSQMQESLGLDEAQFARMIPLVKSLQATRRELAQRRRETLRRLRRELARGRVAEASVAELVDSLRAQRMEESRALDAAYAAVDAELSPIQQGRFRIMEVEVERRIRELLQRARRGGARR
jgi:hypothetical protein